MQDPPRKDLIPEASGAQTPWAELVLKLFPLHLLTRRQYIELGLISIVGAIWMSFFHIRWWGVEKAFAKMVFYTTSIHLILLAHCIYRVLTESSASSERDSLLYKKAGPADRSLWQIWGMPLVLGGLLTIIVAAGVGLEYRILADETNLLGSALSLFLDQTYYNITEGTFYYDTYHVVGKVIDKRPPLFSYLVAVYHLFFGYRAFNGFLVNLTIGFASASLFFHIGRKYFGSVFGILFVASYAAIPVVTIGMGSSGFEAMSALLNTLVIWQCIEFLKNPNTLRMELLLLIFLAASQGRYESVVLVLPVGVVILARFKQLEWHPAALRMLAIPYLFIPLNWQKHMTSALNGGDPEDTVAFTGQFFFKHLPAFFHYWFDFKLHGYPTNLGISIFALLGLALLSVKALRQGAPNRQLTRWALGLGGLAILPFLVIHLSYYNGDLREQPAMHRIGLSYAPACAFLAAYFLWRFFHWTNRGLFAPGVLFLLLLLGLSTASRNPLGRTLVLFREYKEFLSFLEQHPPRGTLLVADRPGMFTVHGYGAIGFETFSKNANEWKSNLERHLYQQILVEQQVFYDKTKPPTPAIPDGFTLETLHEFQNDSEYFIRYSKLIPAPAIDEEPAPHKAHRSKKGRQPESSPHGEGGAFPLKSTPSPSKLPSL